MVWSGTDQFGDESFTPKFESARVLLIVISEAVRSLDVEGLISMAN